MRANWTSLCDYRRNRKECLAIERVIGEMSPKTIVSLGTDRCCHLWLELRRRMSGMERLWQEVRLVSLGRMHTKQLATSCSLYIHTKEVKLPLCENVWNGDCITFRVNIINWRASWWRDLSHTSETSESTEQGFLVLEKFSALDMNFPLCDFIVYIQENKCASIRA
jgi:hypothetical protein